MSYAIWAESKIRRIIEEHIGRKTWARRTELDVLEILLSCEVTLNFSIPFLVRKRHVEVLALTPVTENDLVRFVLQRAACSEPVREESM